jgi:hypothetical protein
MTCGSEWGWASFGGTLRFGLARKVFNGLLGGFEHPGGVEAEAQTLKAKSEADGHGQAGCKIALRCYDVGDIGYRVLLDIERRYPQTALDRARAEAGRYADFRRLVPCPGVGWSNAPQVFVLPHRKDGRYRDKRENSKTDCAVQPPFR